MLVADYQSHQEWEKKKLYKKSKIYAKDVSAHVSKWRNNCDHELEDRAVKILTYRCLITLIKILISVYVWN